MSDISTKLTYLNTTKGKIKDSINLTGANITSNDTFRNYATKLKNGLVDIINNGIDTLYDNFPKVVGEGTEIVLNNTYEAPLKVNAIKGDTQQEGTPTPDTPQEVKTVTGLQNVEVIGKNLFDNSNPTIKADTVIWTPTDTGGIVTNTASWGIGIRWHFYLDTTKQYTFKANGFVNNVYCYIRTYTDDTYSTIKTRMLGDGTGNISNTFTPDSEYVEVMFSNSSAISNISINNIQLEQDSTATTYQPYSKSEYEVNLGTLELCEINTYEDTLQKSSGKNLFDENYENISDNLTYKPIYVGEGTYILSTTAPMNTIGGANIFFLSGNVNTGASTGQNGVYLNRPIQQQSINGYVTIAYRNTLGVNPADYKTQLELGDTATEYEPFGKVWYKRANIGKAILNGSESGWNFQARQNNVYRGYITIPNASTSTGREIAISNYFYAKGGTDETVGNTFINSGQVFLYTNISNISAFKTWLSTNNVEVYYVLKTPTYEIITDTTLINQLESIKSKEGTTNITISGNLPMILNASALEKE